MEKKTYYVSVANSDILEDKGSASFEFEIEATPEELDRLQEMFAGKAEADWDSNVRAHVPFKPYHLDKENDVYDEHLVAIYQMIHNLGKPETKIHIEKMGIKRL